MIQQMNNSVQPKLTNASVVESPKKQHPKRTVRSKTHHLTWMVAEKILQQKQKTNTFKEI